MRWRAIRPASGCRPSSAPTRTAKARANGSSFVRSAKVLRGGAADAHEAGADLQHPHARFEREGIDDRRQSRGQGAHAEASSAYRSGQKTDTWTWSKWLAVSEPRSSIARQPSPLRSTDHIVWE